MRCAVRTEIMSRHLLGALALALCVAAAPSPAAAQQVFTPPERLHAGTLEVPLNKSQVVSIDKTIAKAMIGNEEIADIVPISSTSVSTTPPKTRHGTPAAAQRRATSPGALPTAVVASTRPTPETTSE